jgi:hypothetical protein
VPIEPPNPSVVAGAEADHEGVLGIVNAEREVPTGIFLAGLADRLNSSRVQLLHHPSRDVVAEAPGIDVVFSRFYCVENVAPEGDDAFH